MKYNLDSFHLFTSCFCFFFLVKIGYTQNQLREGEEWEVSNFLIEKSEVVSVSGEPKLIDSPFGKAVYFDGVDDAIFLDLLPLKNLSAFTVEMIFKPDLKGEFEQRFLHIGEVSDDRLLLELRANENTWYFDGFAKSGQHKKALASEKLIHPLNKWYHVAFVVNATSLITYVNGEKELAEAFQFSPIQTGKTSLGVRLNKRSWFKGSIYSIKITPRVLSATDFNLTIND